MDHDRLPGGRPLAIILLPSGLDVLATSQLTNYGMRGCEGVQIAPPSWSLIPTAELYDEVSGT